MIYDGQQRFERDGNKQNESGTRFVLYTKIQRWSSNQRTNDRYIICIYKKLNKITTSILICLVNLLSSDICCITEKEVEGHRKMFENCCVDSLPLLDRTSYFRKPKRFREGAIFCDLIWEERGWLSKCGRTMMVNMVNLVVNIDFKMINSVFLFSNFN